MHRRIESLLRPEEEILLVTREHGIVLVRPFLRAVGVVAAAAAIALALAGHRWLWPLPAVLASLAGLAAASALVRLVRQVAGWHSRTVVVTDRKVLFTRGVVRRRVSGLRLEALEEVDVGSRRRLPGVSCGGLVVSSGGRRGTLFGLRTLPRPDELQELLLELTEEPQAAEAMHA